MNRWRRGKGGNRDDSDRFRGRVRRGSGSLNRPGGNVTEMSVLDAVGPKWLEQLHDRCVIATYKASPFITFFGAIGAYLFLNT